MLTFPIRTIAITTEHITLAHATTLERPMNLPISALPAVADFLVGFAWRAGNRIPRYAFAGAAAFCGDGGGEGECEEGEEEAGVHDGEVRCIEAGALLSGYSTACGGANWINWLWNRRPYIHENGDEGRGLG